MGPTLVTLYGEERRRAHKMHRKARMRAAFRAAVPIPVRARIKRLHPSKRARLAKAMVHGDPALLGEDEELLGVWPWLAKAAKAVAKIGKKGVVALRKEIKYKRGKRAKAAATKMVAQQQAAAAPAETALPAATGKRILGLPPMALAIGGGALALVLIMGMKR